MFDLLPLGPGPADAPKSREPVPVPPVDATPRKLIALSEGGVYDRTEAKGAFCGAESRAVETLEGGPVTQ